MEKFCDRKYVVKKKLTTQFTS